MFEDSHHDYFPRDIVKEHHLSFLCCLTVIRYNKETSTVETVEAMNRGRTATNFALATLASIPSLHHHNLNNLYNHPEYLVSSFWAPLEPNTPFDLYELRK
jgi:hypothetical protein